MNKEEIWQEGEWDKLCAVVHSRSADYGENYFTWLRQKPELWHSFVAHGLMAVEKNDPYGFSAVALLDILQWYYSPEDYERAKTDYQHAGDLGRLLIAIHPETHESLWRGERYVHPMLQNSDEFAKRFEEVHDSYIGFLVTDEPHKSGPGCRVFPELANLPAAEPVDDVGHA